MEQIRARVEARSRREAAEAVEPERGPAPDAEPEREGAVVARPPSESFAFHGNSIYWSSRGGGVGQLLRASRRLLAPLVKFVFNVDPMVDALATQARRNAQQAAFDDDVARRLAAREEQDALNRRAVESLTAEMKRLAADLKSQRTLVESVLERLGALERAGAGEPATGPHRGRDDEGPDVGPPASPATTETPPPSGKDDDESPDVDGPASPAAARSTPPGDQQADSREDGAPAPPPAADTPPPNR